MFLKTSKDISAFVIIYFVEVLVSLKKLSSFVQRMFTEPPLWALGWGRMVLGDKMHEFLHLL